VRGSLGVFVVECVGGVLCVLLTQCSL
jgi:hypothetical protein